MVPNPWVKEEKKYQTNNTYLLDNGTFCSQSVKMFPQTTAYPMSPIYILPKVLKKYLPWTEVDSLYLFEARFYTL